MRLKSEGIAGLFQVTGDEAELLFAEIGIDVLKDMAVLVVVTGNRVDLLGYEFDVGLSPVKRVRDPTYVAGALEAVDDPGDGTRGQAGCLAQLLGRPDI